MIRVLVTGGAGLIGSNLIKNLNKNGIEEILVVDDLTDGSKITNLSTVKFVDYVDKDDFKADEFKDIECIFHLGACSSTTERNGRYLMKNNYEYSKKLLHHASDHNIKYIYASSASVYGLGKNGYREGSSCELPINPYAFSKFQFDRYVRNNLHRLKNVTIGLRYFNVYGPGEHAKGDMASVIYKFYNQAVQENSIKLFGAGEGANAGEHMRDFVHVDDCASVNFWMFENQQKSGIYNIGTGTPTSFNTIAEIIKYWFFKNKNLDLQVQYIDFPESLKGQYQSYTCADLDLLRSQGYNNKLISIQDGINSYLDFLDGRD